jgi:glycosyltransferase involved in cell wall biosynthesis
MFSLSWICCQIGAREHYAIPRALNQCGKLNCLIVDAWVTPTSILERLAQAGLRERFHHDLAQAKVHAFNTSIINFEIAQKLGNSNAWERIIARNLWFQKKTLKVLQTLKFKSNTQPVFFSYSYAALNLLKFAKSQGWLTVLGQIDPGIVEEQIVASETSKYPKDMSHWQPAPPEYWSNWREECSLADRILVNSSWSSKAIQKLDIPVNKIAVVPLAYESPKSAQNFIRTYPKSFSSDRPLRVLFLGQVILRKGIMSLLEALEILKNEPIELWVVGSLGINIPESIRQLKQIHLTQAVSRSATQAYYQKADVFILPTLSDGFGLTQLEAQAWKLPVIASKNCGEVVQDSINGLVLNETSAKNIAQALIYCLKNPLRLQFFADNSIDNDRFSLSKLANSLNSIF